MVVSDSPTCFPLSLVIALLIILLVSSVSVWMSYDSRCSQKVLNEPLKYIDGWSFTHFVMYAVLGILYPSLGYLVLCIGVGFELFEFSLDQIKVGGWYAKYSDVVVNLLGFFAGVGIGRFANNNSKSSFK
jgi:hypothetical protein